MRKTTGSRRKDLMLDSSRGSALLRGVDLSGAKIGSTLRIRLSHDYQVVPRTMLRLYEEPIIPPLMNAWDRFHLEGTVLFPTIYRHTETQLDAAVERAAQLPEFWVMLHGIDAYMERRRRRVKAAREKLKINRIQDRFALSKFDADEFNWGDQ